MITETKTIDSSVFVTGWEYNSANLVKKMKYPDGEMVNYSYHSQLALNSVVGMSGYVTVSYYDAARRITHRDPGNGWSNYSATIHGIPRADAC